MRRYMDGIKVNLMAAGLRERDDLNWTNWRRKRYVAMTSHYEQPKEEEGSRILALRNGDQRWLTSDMFFTSFVTMRKLVVLRL